MAVNVSNLTNGPEIIVKELRDGRKIHASSLVTASREPNAIDFGSGAARSPPDCSE